jgi:hypothetical protein
MNPIIKNILAVVAGVVIGGALNSGIIMISSSVIPPPNGADVTTMEGLKAALPFFQPKHFIMPFLAHALGTLLGAFIAAKFSANHKMIFAYVIGGFFLIGGISNVFMLPSPVWFTIVDLVLAYIPMSFIASKLAIKNK